MDPLVDAAFISSINSGISAIQVYDTKTGTNLKSYNGPSATPSSMNFVGKSEYLLSGVKDKPFLQAWHLNRSDPIHTKLVAPGRISLVAISTGPYYCAIAISENIFLYKLSSGRLLGVLKQHYQPITCLQFSSNGTFLISGGEDGLVLRWNIRNVLDALHLNDVPEPHLQLSQHSDQVTDLSITAGMRAMVFSSSTDSTVNIYDLVSGKLMYTLILPEEVSCVTANKLGNQCFIGTNAGNVYNVHIYPHLMKSSMTIDEESKYKCHEGKITCITFTSAGEKLLTGGEDGEVKAWKITTTKKGLALHKTLHTGRGNITNIKVQTIEREIFTAAKIDPIEILAPISSAILTDDSTVETVYLGKGDNLENISFKNDFRDTSSIEAKHYGESSDEMKIAIQNLKSINSELYKYAVENILNGV